MTRPHVAAELDAFADEIDNRLSNEHADRQAICEDAAARMRRLAKQAASAAAAVPGAAELAARRTAAAAVLGDYRHKVLVGSAGGPAPDWEPWSRRLAIAVDSLIDATGDGQAAGLTAQQRGVLGQAIADAIEYRTPGADCTGCDDSPAGLCGDHADDLDRADSYLDAARQLGLEATQ